MAGSQLTRDDASAGGQASSVADFGEPVQNGQVTFTPPSTGASASFGSDIAVIDGIGEASATPQANAIAGNYQISATASGVSGPATAQLAAGVSTTATAQALWSSVEHRSDEVDQDYLTLLKRQSDAPGRAAWIAILESTGSETTVAIGMMSSVEYRQLHAGAAAWINAVYNDALGRTPAAQDVNFLVSQIAVGVPFSTIAQVIVNSTESTLRVVGSYYAAMLDRAMKPADAAYWAQDLAATQRGVGSAAVDILGAAEYQDLARNSVR